MPDEQANAELDARVAEEVMEWKPTPYKYFTRWTDPDGRSVTTGGAGSDSSLNWSPSTGIAAAWGVVEKFIADGYGLDVGVEPDLDGKGPDWNCVIWRGGHEIARAHGPTAPLAICRAALAAVRDSETPLEPEPSTG